MVNRKSESRMLGIVEPIRVARSLERLFRRRMYAQTRKRKINVSIRSDTVNISHVGQYAIRCLYGDLLGNG